MREDERMKLVTGGGGVDANGKSYTLPKKEVEVSDTWFDDLLQGIFSEDLITSLPVGTEFFGLVDEVVERRSKEYPNYSGYRVMDEDEA